MIYCMKRMGEKTAWVFGWMGAFLWVLILGLVEMNRHEYFSGVVLLVLWALSVFLIFKYAPWRSPFIRYWQLMMPLYGLLASLVLILYVFIVGIGDAGRYSYFLLGAVPALLPLFIIGARRWATPAPTATPTPPAPAPAESSVPPVPSAPPAEPRDSDK